MITGYFSVADRGTFGHWDFSDEQGRRYTLRGDPDIGFVLTNDRKPQGSPFSRIPFSTPYEALEFVARQIMSEPIND